MAAYLIARIEVTDPARYVDYASQTVDVASKYGGKFLVKGGRMTRPESDGPERCAVIEFPDRAAAEAFYASPEYAAILPIALEASRRDVVIVDGV